MVTNIKLEEFKHCPQFPEIVFGYTRNDVSMKKVFINL